MYKCSLERMKDKIATFSQFGDAGHGGITRYSLSPAALQARNEFERRMTAIGATIEVDDVGCMYATINGSDPSLKRIVMGSHVDSVKNGGNYDGILGVMSAMEVLETVVEQNIPHKHPLTAMIWTNEEGSLYPPAMMCSGIICYDYLPEDIRERYRLADYNFALKTVHFPKNRQELLIARRRLVFDEFLLFILAVQQLKGKTEEAKNQFPMKSVWATEEIIENIPYKLTNAQMNVWHEIERDMTSHSLMSRLVQGDVGSGKTILAFLGMIMASQNGYQSALMVPTEVLARQHFEAFKKLMDQHGIACHPVLLTGSNTAKEKRQIPKNPPLKVLFN